MPDEYYQSSYTGQQIDNAIGRIINGELDKLVEGASTAAEAAQNILDGVNEAIASIPPGSTPIINDLTTGGVSMALSAEMGKLLGAHAQRHATGGVDPITPAMIGAVALNDKPFNYYFGNGDATSRDIPIGGTGNVCVIYDSTGQSMAICTPAGAIYKNSGSGMISYFDSSALRFSDGVLTVATANSALNYNGGAYFYQVL